MSSDRIIADGIKVAQDLLRQSLPPTHNLTDAGVVLRFREFIRSQAIRSALERSSDTALAFALREVERVLSCLTTSNGGQRGWYRASEAEINHHQMSHRKLRRMAYG
jgi:hypothetical protein